MKSKTNQLAWLCGALALSVAPLQAQESKPADQPPAAVQPIPTVPKADETPAPARRDQPRPDERRDGNAPRPDSMRDPQRRPEMGGQRDGAQPQRDGQPGPVNPPQSSGPSPTNPPNTGNRNPDQGSGREGFRRPPMDGQRGGEHQRGEVSPQGNRGAPNPSHEDNRGPMNKPQHEGKRGQEHAGRQNHFRQPQEPRGKEQGGFQPRADGHGPQSFAQRGRGRGEQGRMGHRFGGHRQPQQFGSQRQGAKFGGARGPEPRFEQRRGPAPQQFGSHRGGEHPGGGHQHLDHPMHQPQHGGMSGGGRGQGPSPHGGSHFQHGGKGHHGQQPMNQERGREGQPRDRSV